MPKTFHLFTQLINPLPHSHEKVLLGAGKEI